MGYKHGLEKKKFDAEWNKNERIYHELGMSNEQIASIKEFDYDTFCSDRAYFEKKIDLTDVEDKLQSNEFSIDEYNIEENWHEYISDSEKRKKLSALRPIERRAYYLNTVMKMAHRDISLILLTPRRSISRWIVKIAEILK